MSSALPPTRKPPWSPTGAAPPCGTSVTRTEAGTLKITTECTGPRGHIDSEHLARVEAELLQQLEREGIITGFYRRHGNLPDGQGSWLALRWLPGEEVDTAFAKLRQSPDDRRAAGHAAAMAGAVADLHDRGWRHGDMQEVHFLLHHDRAHLLDFAMAQPPNPAGPPPVTYRGAYDFFNSPELAARRLATKPSEHLALTAASEVWSLCATIYACWTGIYPISEKDTTLTTPGPPGRARVRPLPRPHHHPPLALPALEAAITSGLDLDPDRRPTARQLQSRFKKLTNARRP